MWFEHSVPAPERLPDVPMRLGDCLRAFTSGTIRIDLHVRVGKGWRKINALRFVEGDDTQDPEQIAATIKACADHHAAEAHAPGQYRAMVWRYFGGELERRKAAFQVELARPERHTPPRPGRSAPPPRRSRPLERPRTLDVMRMLDTLVGPERRPARTPQRGPHDQWRKALETRAMLDEILAQPDGVPFDPFAALRSLLETPLQRIRRELAEMSAIFEEGERSKAADGMDLAELHIHRKLAMLREQEDAAIWTELAPTIEAGLVTMREQALAKRTAATKLEPPSTTGASPAAPNAGQAGEPTVERDEGAPPSTDDAPSAGELGSGA